MVQQQRQRLSKVLGRTDVLAMAFGTMVGWGWVVLPASWVQEAGVFGAILAFALGAIMCIFVGLAYAELTPALPLAGGEMVFAYRGLGYKSAWISAWSITLAYIGVAAWEGIAIATAIEYIFPIPKIGFLWNISGDDVYASWAVIGVAGAIILSILNYLGIKASAIFQVMAAAGLVFVGIVFFLGGAAFGNPKHLVPFFTDGRGILNVLMIAPSMYIGFDVIPQFAEEMNIPLRRIAYIFISVIVAAACWYFLIIIGFSLSAPPEVRNNSAVPVADAMAYAFRSNAFGKLLIGGAICGIFTSWNGFIVAATRVLFAMGRAKMLPGVFGKVHPKYKTPTASIIFVGIICSLSPLLGKNALIWLVEACSFGTVVAYLFVALSFVVIAKKERNLKRPFKVKGRKWFSYVTVVITVFFIALYLPVVTNPFSWPYQWLLILGWSGLGLLLAVGTQTSYGNISDVDREYMIFGEEYAREEILYQKKSNLH